VLVVFTIPITEGEVERLVRVYSEVFSGRPYFEDRVCSGVKDDKDPCKLQYTSRVLPKDFEQADLEKRTGVVGSTDRENCQACGRGLISFYPDFINQRELILNALSQEGAIGYLLERDKRAIGFTLGYRVPEEETPSVNFPPIRPLLEEQGIEPARAFYCAELGIIDSERRKGLGLLLSTQRIYQAAQNGFATLLVRTKNPAIRSINQRLFGTGARELFQDPDRDYSWFGWSFETFNNEEALSVIGGQNEY